MISCPNKNTKEWKELERMYGDYAYLIWNEHSGNIPLSEYSGPAFNKHQSILDKLSRIVNINDSGNVFTNGELLKDNVLEQIKNIVVRENSLYRKNYRFFRTKSGNYILMDGNQFVYYNKSNSEFISNNAAIAILDQFKNKLGVDYEIITPEKASSILKDSPEPYTDETGFYYKNKVYLVDNGEGIDFDSTIHEFAHPFVRAISIHNPSLFASIMNQIIDTPEGKSILREVVELGYNDNMINEEVAVRAITKLAKKNFDPSTGKLFEEAVKKLLRYLATLMRNIFGKQDLKISEIDPNFTLEQLADIFSLKPGTITLNSENIVQASIKPGVEELFESNPELANIGTQKQYSQYLDTIFPDSKVKDMLFKHFSSTKIDRFDKKKILSNTGIAHSGKGFYFFHKLPSGDISYLGKEQHNVLLNVLNPVFAKEIKNNFYGLEQKEFEHKVEQYIKEKKYDSLLGNYDYETFEELPLSEIKNFGEFVVFEPEQIHILGSKEDIEGFKKFVETPAFNKKSVSEKKESRSQKEIYDSLNPQGKISKSDAGYVVLGETGYKRVTEIVRSKFNLGNLEKSTAQELGDLFHAHASNLIAAAFPEFNKHYKFIKLEGVPQETLININNIIQPIIDKARKDGSVLVTELPIANTKTKIAGTVDLLEITKEGKVIMLDYKTSMNKGTTVGKYKKLAGNSKQQALYKEILSKDDERLGRQSIEVGYQSLMNIISYVSRAGKIGYKVQETVPVLYQNTLNKKRDEMLSILYDQIENLVGKINKENREKINKLVEAKRELMVKIQKNVKDSDIIQTAAADVAAIEAYLSNNDDIENYVEFRGDLELYRNLSDYVEVSLSKDKDTIDMIQGKSARLLLDLYNKSENKLSKDIAADLSFEGSPIQSADDVMKPVQDINLYKAMAFGASYTNNPVVYGIYQKVMEKLGIVRKKSLELANKIKETVSELETFMGGVGESIYEPLLQYKDGEKTGYVVDKYVPEYWNLRRKARQESDIQWFKDNALYDEDAYKKSLKNQTEYINSTKNARIASKIQYLKNKPEYAKNAKENAEKFVEQEIKNEIEKWAKNNNNIVQFNKPKDKWIDPKWKDIKEGKYKGTPVEKFYDLYINTMNNLEESALLPFDFRGNFIADFRKSFLDRVMNNGIGNMKLGKSLVDSLSIPYDEAEVNKINPFTGEFIRRIPIVGKKILSSEERKIFNKTEKSFDLGNSLAVFFESAVRYKELTEIEKHVEVARDMLQKQKEEITNVKGENVKGGFNLIKVSKGLDNTISQFNYFVDSTIYGKPVGKETGTEIEGNGITQALGLLEKGDKTTLSWTKSLDSLLKYTGLNNLGYNLYAPVTNLLGGKSMQLLMGIGGRWYSAKDYNFASIVVSAGPFSKASEDIEKANLFVEMINPQVNEFVKDKFEDLKSENKLLKKIPGPFSAMQWSEDHLHKAGLIAMIKSNKHSVKWDEWEVENGKLVYKGKDKVEDSTIERFRQKVLHVTGRAIGNMNPDDKIMLKKWFMGRAVIQHRGWIPAMLSAHWSERQYDYALGEYVEGRFNSFLRFITTKKLNWKSLDEVEKANVREAVAEFGIIIGAYMLYTVLKSAGEDDEETKKRLAYFLKISDRYLAEMTFFTPFEISGKHQILISPAPTISTLESWGRLISDLTTYMVVEEKEKEKIDKRLGKRFARVVPSLSQPVRFIDEVIFNQTEEHK